VTNAGNIFLVEPERVEQKQSGLLHGIYSYVYGIYRTPCYYSFLKFTWGFAILFHRDDNSDSDGDHKSREMVTWRQYAKLLFKILFIMFRTLRNSIFFPFSEA
jgi:hypothetical protein